MIKPAPSIDHRTSDQISEMLNEKILSSRLSIDAPRHDPLVNALVQVFARFSEHVIHRLNRVPEKNFIAFLDRLNISRRSPLPAWAPLTFTPVAKLPPLKSTVIVPAGTKVAAAPGEGESAPSVFETSRDLFLTDWKPRSILMLDPQTDQFADLSHLAAPNAAETGQYPFEADQPVAHEFFIAHGGILSEPGISQLQLDFQIPLGTVSGPSGHEHRLTWFMISPDGRVLLEPVSDTTEQLRRSGRIVFEDLPEAVSNPVAGDNDHWLGCRLHAPLPLPKDKNQPQQPLPVIAKMTLAATWAVDQGTIDAAYFNSAVLDLSKDFYPLGNHPRFGDVFYLSCTALGKAGADIELAVTLTNPASGQQAMPLPPVNNSGNPVVRWEYWNGRKWKQINGQDSTQGFTENGAISYTVPADVSQVSVNGMAGHWLRARLMMGDYGRIAMGTEQDGSSASALSPPSIAAIEARISSRIGPTAPRKILTHNNLAFDRVYSDAAFHPFQPPADDAKRLYIGFERPPAETSSVDNPVLDLYFHVSGSDQRLTYRASQKRKPSPLIWECFTGQGWIQTRVIDTTEGLTTSGTVRVVMAEPMVPKANFATPPGLCWLRASKPSGSGGCRPLLQRVHVNTVPARHTMTIRNEILGASNGLPHQRFKTARRPVLETLQLEIREPTMPSEPELRAIGMDENHDGLTVVKDAHGRIQDVWVRWKEVNAFMRSNNRHRHFTVDRQNGVIHFGDGIHGMIPPPGSNNVRLTTYQTGGGMAGNQPIGAIAQLRTSVPFVDAVMNCEPATGGHDIERWKALQRRGTSELRHRRRAVTVEDVEDLAALATPLVAKTKCYPNRDLEVDPDGLTIKPAIASLVVVPQSAAPRPLPDHALLQTVAGYLERYMTADIELLLLAPEYVQINIDAVVMATPPASGAAVAAQCHKAIERYLHPIHGGPDGAGWPFGEHPFESDLFGMLDQVEGLDHVQHLHMEWVEDRPGLLNNKLFLVAGGRVKVMPGVTFPEDGLKCR